MKRHTLYLIIAFLFTCSTQLQAQIDGYWTNPINQVPFEVTSMDSTFQIDSLITVFSGEQTYYIDSVGVKVWNVISLPVYQSIFGYSTFPGGNPIIETYFDLFTITITQISDWDLTDWDALITSEPWITNRTLKLSSADLGALVAWDWYNMTLPSSKLILDPTVPIIEGEDMDYELDIPNNVNMALDIDDYKTNSEEIEAVIDHGIYTFNKPDFKIIYDDFVVWMIETKPFYPDSLDFNTYHDWLYEYFNPIALSRISQVISTPKYQNDLILFEVSKGIYTISGDYSSSIYQVITTQGKVLSTGTINNNIPINITQLPQGIYFLNININGNKSTYKISN